MVSGFELIVARRFKDEVTLRIVKGDEDVDDAEKVVGDREEEKACFENDTKDEEDDESNKGAVVNFKLFKVLLTKRRLVEK